MRCAGAGAELGEIPFRFAHFAVIEAGKASDIEVAGLTAEGARALIFMSATDEFGREAEVLKRALDVLRGGLGGHRSTLSVARFGDPMLESTMEGPRTRDEPPGFVSPRAASP